LIVENRKPLKIFRSRSESATVVLTSLGAVALLFSIAAAETLFALALLALLISRRPLRFPARLGLPLLAFVGWSLLSLAFSSHPMSGLSQIRKIFIFLVLVLVYNAYQNRKQIEWTYKALVAAAVAVSLWGIGQFAGDYLRLKHEDLPFYQNYVAHQIEGFMSHWMTFGGELMLVLVLLAAALMLGWPAGGRLFWWIALPTILIALLASFTRGMWLGTLAGFVYIFARSRRALLYLLPVVIVALYLLAPRSLQDRERSIFDSQTDSSNRARLVMLHTGLAMIKAHPIFGIGPERIGPEFLLYKPASMPLPHGWYGHLHNDYLQIAAERGLPCLFFFLWFFFEVVRLGLAANHAAGHAQVAVTAAFLTAGVFEFNFGDSEVLMLFFFIFAAAAAWQRLRQKSPVIDSGLLEHHRKIAVPNTAAETQA